MSAEGIFVLGATHHTAPLEVREKLSLSAEEAQAFHADLGAISGLREFTVLNTCNRIEIYGLAEGPDVPAAVQSAFCNRQQFDGAAFELIRMNLWNQAALEHLFSVAAGLESQMIGETEIFGQVKEAYATAQARGATGPILNRVFQKAFQSAKMARTHTAITEGHVSVANVAVDLALNIFGSLTETRILLLGAGDIGERTAKAFRSRGARKLTVSTRRMERAMELAVQFGASALPFEERETQLASFDVVVGSTAAPDLVISAAAVTTAMHRRPARPLFCIDLALPRDIDPAVAHLQNVYLYNLDDLARIAEENRVARSAEIGKCRVLLRERVEALWRHVSPKLTTAGGEDRPTPAYPSGRTSSP